MGLGLIVVGLTEKKQGLHDIMAGCLVINKDVADTQTHYSHLQDFLRSPVIAASVIACAGLIAFSMYTPSRDLPDSSVQDIPKLKLELGRIELGPINVALQTKEPLDVRQFHSMSRSRYYGTTQPLEIKLSGDIKGEHKVYSGSAYSGGGIFLYEGGK